MISPEAFLNENGSTEKFALDGLSNSNKKLPRGFEFIRADQLQLTQPEYLIENILEVGTLALLIAEPGCYKTFLALSMATTIATGTGWFGHATAQGAVFYIAGEGFSGLARRLAAWQKYYAVSLVDKPLYISCGAAQFLNKESAEAVTKAVQILYDRTKQKPCLIIIDTLARNFGDGDENSSADMSHFICALDELKGHCAASVLIIHHTGHTDKRRARGSTALKGALDHEYLLTKNADGFVTMTCTKMKDAAEPELKCFKLVSVPILLDGFTTLQSATLTTVEAPVPNAGKKLSPQKKRALDILYNCLIEKGQIRTINEDMPQLNCVTLDQYQEALRLGNIVDSDNQNNIDRCIRRIITELNNQNITATYENFIWIPDKSDKTGRTRQAYDCGRTDTDTPL